MKYKVLSWSLVMILLSYRLYAQEVPNNFNTVDSTKYSLLYKTLHHKYDEIIGYTTENYWQSDHCDYVFLGVKNGNYFKGTVNQNE